MHFLLWQQWLYCWVPSSPNEAGLLIPCTRHKCQLSGKLRLREMPLVQQHAVQQYVYTHSFIPSLPPPPLLNLWMHSLFMKGKLNLFTAGEEFLQKGDMQWINLRGWVCMPVSLSGYCGTCWYLQSCIGRTLILHLKMWSRFSHSYYFSYSWRLFLVWFWKNVVKSALACLML